MENFESKKIPPEDVTKKENKSNFTKFNEQEAEKVREKIKKLMEKNEELKKKLDDLST